MSSISLLAVPTNIITGFLGAGKTTAILNLLRSKKQDESWAVLVNEFGEIGVDGGLINGQRNDKENVYIREVPGGCMCCAAGLPMQIALNQLLTRAQPKRLLIEPTGLGHPKEVLEVLSNDYYKDVLSIQKIITLVDARKLSEERYTQHATFNQQIAIADIVVGNKVDLYHDNEQAQLVSYVEETAPEHTEVVFTQNGELTSDYLHGDTKTLLPKKDHHHHHSDNRTLVSERQIPEIGFLKAENEGEGMRSIGWRFSPNKIFDYSKLFNFLSGLNVERMKAIFITGRGIFAYNLTPDALSEIELDETEESYVEIIATQLDENWEKKLLNCLQT